MQLSTVLPVLLAIATSATAEIGCYTNNAATVWAQDAVYHGGRACRGYDGKRGSFQGSFGPNASKAACVNIYGDRRLIMSVSNLNGDKSFDLGDEDCANEFINLLLKCSESSLGKALSTGGYNRQSGWIFKYVLISSSS